MNSWLSSKQVNINYISIMNILFSLRNNAVLMGKTSLISSILAGVIIGFGLLWIVIPGTTNADFNNTTNASYVAKTSNKAKNVTKTLKVVITAYSSSWDETTGIPGVAGTITASGKKVANGIVANNKLPFGTKIRIPSLYGDKIFVVEDRMNKRMGEYRFDIWMPSKQEAKIFGVQKVEIEILET